MLSPLEKRKLGELQQHYSAKTAEEALAAAIKWEQSVKNLVATDPGSPKLVFLCKVQLDLEKLAELLEKTDT